MQQHRRAVEQTIDGMEAFFDVAVAGAGPAGLTAALFAARAGLSVLVLGGGSGQLSEATALDNFPGFLDSDDSLKGAEWLTVTRRQAAQAGALFAQAGLLVSRITQNDNNGMFALELDHDNLVVPARSFIIATGATARRLPLSENYDHLWGRQVHSCAICDGSAYQNRRVVVVGGGDAAVDAALLLATRHNAQVTLVHRRDEFRARSSLRLLKETSGVTVLTPFIFQEYVLDPSSQKLTGVVVQNVVGDESTQTIACDGVFIMIGSTPNTAFLAPPQAADAGGSE